MAGRDTSGLDVPPLALRSPDRGLLEPLVGYIDEVEATGNSGVGAAVLPEVATEHRWGQLLHNQTASRPQIALHGEPHVVCADYRYYLG